MTELTRHAVNLADKLAQFDEHWSPRTVARFNGHDVMVVKVQGEFVWHHHDDTDDFFLVLSGRLTIRMRDGDGARDVERDVELGPGELFVVPVGMEHQPCSSDGAELLLIEPSGTPNTGDAATAARRIEI
jgi:mannose-6-phosphate isomerase-like protein (cupin superfamily)